MNGEFGIAVFDGIVEHSFALFNSTFGIAVVGGVARGNASDSIFVNDGALLGNWIENELELLNFSGYADNVIDGVVTDDAGNVQPQPIGCNLIGGNLVCPEGGAAL